MTGEAEIGPMPEPVQLPVPRVDNWQLLYRKGARARCIKDGPPMKGFGRDLKTGDIVEVDAVCWEGYYTVSVPSETAVYTLEGYFEVCPSDE